MESIKRKRIFQLEQNVGAIVGQTNLKVSITKYYKKIGQSAPSFLTMWEEVTHDISQLSVEESTILKSPFTEEEVFETISQIEHNKAPGLHGCPGGVLS
jgi:hypothetical protein